MRRRLEEEGELSLPRDEGGLHFLLLLRLLRPRSLVRPRSAEVGDMHLVLGPLVLSLLLGSVARIGAVSSRNSAT